MQNRFKKIIICFAVKEEAQHLSQAGWVWLNKVSILITGIGQQNANRSVSKSFELDKPDLVLSCGFAGGLNPGLKFGTIVYNEDAGLGLSEILLKSGALSSSFYCAERVAITAIEKAAIRNQTGADAIEMESSAIRSACRERGIPSATVRVISDTAQEDLPLDFNFLMTSDKKINYWKLFRELLMSPKQIPRLIQFQTKTNVAARKLSCALNELLRPELRR